MALGVSGVILIWFVRKHRTRGRVFSSMRRFSEVIEDLGLRDIPLQVDPFTWRARKAISAASFNLPCLD